MPSRRHSEAMLSSPRKPSITIRIFSSAENRRRVLRRMPRTAFSADAFVAMDSFSPRSLEPSLRSETQIVQTQLTGNTAKVRAIDVKACRDYARSRLRPVFWVQLNVSSTPVAKVPKCLFCFPYPLQKIRVEFLWNGFHGLEFG